MRHLSDLTPNIAIHPGDYLADELKARKLSQSQFAKMVKVQKSLLNELIKGKRSISAKLALKLGKVLEIDPVVWLNLQIKYDLDIAKIKYQDELKQLETIDGVEDLANKSQPRKTKAIMINDSEGLGVKYAKLLSKVGINSIEDLISEGAGRENRERLCKQMGIPSAKFKEWIKLAEQDATDKKSVNKGVRDLKSLLEKEYKIP